MLSLVFHHTRTDAAHRRGVPEGRSRLGRTVDNEIALEFDENVSRHHANVTRTGRRIQLEDAGSRNGILQCGVHVQSVELRPGDAPVQIGASFVTVEEADTDDLLPAFSVERAVHVEQVKATLPIDDQDDAVIGRSLHAVVHKSPQMRSALRRAIAFAGRPRPILLLGETGTGKEVVARVVHDNGPYAKGPWIPVNCATLTPDLIASELFGIEEGVATGVRGRGGLFMAAEGGTLFLDEIGDIDVDMQGTLLRAIQQNEVRAAGMRRPRTLRMHVILATNRKERLRPDLVSRCSVIEIPPLRDRPEDVEELTRRFLDESSQAISRSALSLLKAHPWPGNVRELLGVLDNAAADLGDGMLQAEHLATLLDDGSPARSLRKRRAALTRAEVDRALREHHGNQSAAARSLGMSRSGLRKAMQRV